MVVNRFSDNNDNSIITLATWRKQTGQDAHSIIATPAQLFVNAAANDYRLVSGSPAVNAGTALAQVTDDIVGTARPKGGLYDIGCYESF